MDTSTHRDAYADDLALSDEQKQAVEVRLSERLAEARAAHETRDNQIDRAWQWYKGDVKSLRTNIAWDGRGANFHSHLVRAVCDSYWSQLPQVFMSADPLVHVTPDPSYIQSARGVDWDAENDRAQQVERELHSRLTAKTRFKETLDQVILRSLIEKGGLLENVWVRRTHTTTTYRETVGLEVRKAPGPLPFLPDLSLRLRKRRKVARDVEMVDYEGPECRVVPMKDLLLWPALPDSLEDAEMIAIREWVTDTQLAGWVADGTLNPEWAEELEDARSAQDVLAGSGPRYRSEPGPRDLRLLWQGGDGMDGLHCLWRVCIPFAESESEEPRDAYFVVHANTGKLLRACWYPRYAGMRHLHLASPIPSTGTLYSEQVPLILEPLQQAVNALLNLATDNARLSVQAPKAILRDAGITPEEFKKRWVPGGVVAMDDPSKIFMPPVPNFVASLFQCYEAAMTAAERVARTGDTAFARVTDRNKTLGEVQLAASQNATSVDLYQRRIDQTLQRVFAQQADMIYQLLPPDALLSYSQGGGAKAQVFSIPASSYGPGLRYEPQGASIAADQAQKFSRVQVAWQMAGGLSLVAGHPKRQWELARQVFQALRIQNLDGVLGTEEEADQDEALAQQQRQLTQAQVGAQLAQLQQVTGTPPESGTVPSEMGATPEGGEPAGGMPAGLQALGAQPGGGAQVEALMHLLSQGGANGAGLPPEQAPEIQGGLIG